MNINKIEEVNALTNEDLFEAIASEMQPIDLYEDGKVLEAHKFTALKSVSFADAKMVMNIRTDIRRRFIEAYPEYGIFAAMPGDTVKFGSYVQREGKGADSIEWIVLAVDQKKLLLISKCALESKAYHNNYEAVTWEKSDLRAWLNSEFVEKAFTKIEKCMIPFTTIRPDKDVNVYGTHGENTNDKVFVLSPSEAQAYLATEEERVGKSTELSKAQGIYVNAENEGIWWWLRTPGWNPMNYTQTYVNNTGEIKLQGDPVNHTENGVRPALWIGLE